MNATDSDKISRRRFLGHSAVSIGAASLGRFSGRAQDATASTAPCDKALIAITLDLEMARNFPTWEDTHWDYEKGNLNPESKAYAVEACRRVKAHGGVLHCFCVGRV